MMTPYILAEIANTHEGRFDLLKELVQKTAQTGANGVKFQVIVADELVASGSSQRGVFKKLEFSSAEWSEIFAISVQLGLDVWADVYGFKGLAITDEFKKIHGYKAHTSDILNESLLCELGRRRRPLLLSCSGSTDVEIARAIAALRSDSADARIILMHGFQSYPTPLQETNLKDLKRLRTMFGLEVGIMDHLDGETEAALLVPMIAASLGVELIEKHITLDRLRKGTDYFSSLNPNEFRKMTDYIRGLSDVMGAGQEIKTFSESEQRYGMTVKKKLISVHPLLKGHILEERDLVFKRTDELICSLLAQDVIGRTLIEDLDAEKAIRLKSLEIKTALIVTFSSKSSLFPNRFMAEVDGRPAFHYLLDCLRKVRNVGRILLCTTNMSEDDAFFEVAKKTDVSIVRVNEQISLDMVGNACLYHLAEDIVVHVAADNILVDPAMIERGLDKLMNENLEHLCFSGLPKGCRFDIFKKKVFLDLWPYIRRREDSTDLDIYFTRPGLVHSLVLDSGHRMETSDVSLAHPDSYKRILDFLSWSKDRSMASMVVFLREKEGQKRASTPVTFISQVDFKTLINQAAGFQNPLVTVYLTAYNYGKYIETAIKSVLKQTFRDWELIIINDGSKDNTEKVIQKYAANPRIKIINNSVNKGLTHSSNLALRLAQGEYIIRLDADDHFDENALLVMTNAFLADPSLDMVYPDYYLMNSQEEVTTIVRRKKIGEEVELLDLPAHGACTMIKTKSLREVGGYNEEIDREDEFDLWLRCHRRFKISNINLPLFYYCKHGASLTDNQVKITETKRKILRKYAQEEQKKNGHEILRLGIIPIRAHTEFGYHTHLHKVGGLTLLEWSVASAGKLFDLLVITSEDLDVLEYAKERFPEVKTVFRPEVFVRQNVSLRKTIEFVLKAVEQKGEIYEEIAVLFVEYPLRTVKHVQQAFDTMTMFNVDSVVDVLPTDRQFFTHGRHGLEPVGDEKELRLERKALLKNVGSLLVIKRANLSSKEHLGAKRGHIVIPKEESFGVHSSLDLKIVDMIMKEEGRSLGQEESML